MLFETCVPYQNRSHFGSVRWRFSSFFWFFHVVPPVVQQIHQKTLFKCANFYVIPPLVEPIPQKKCFLNGWTCFLQRYLEGFAQTRILNFALSAVQKHVSVSQSDFEPHFALYKRGFLKIKMCMFFLCSDRPIEIRLKQSQKGPRCSFLCRRWGLRGMRGMSDKWGSEVAGRPPPTRPSQEDAR